MRDQIVFAFKFLFMLGSALFYGVFLAYALSLLVDLALGLRMGESTMFVIIPTVPFFVLFCMMKFIQNNTAK